MGPLYPLLCKGCGLLPVSRACIEWFKAPERRLGPLWAPRRSVPLVRNLSENARRSAAVALPGRFTLARFERDGLGAWP